jgi:hypothetical protein
MKNKVEELITEELLDQQLESRNLVREIGMPNKKFGFDLPMSHFLKLMYVHFTSQSYGSRIENRIIQENKLTKVPSSFDKGDAKTKLDKYGEIKISFKNTKGDFSFVQIRPHQKCHFYLLQAIDENFKPYTFIVTIDEIDDVLKEFKATNCHGVSKNKKDVSQEELRFTVSHNSAGWSYLCDNFLCNDLNTKLMNI